MKYSIAVVCGGYSSEYSISLKSANGIMSWLDRGLFEPYKVVIEKTQWYVLIEEEQYPIDKSDFSFIKDDKKITFDYAYITIHGTPGEDGLLQGYFDMIGLRYNTSGVLQESLTFNKYICNKYLSTLHGVRIAKSIRLIDENGKVDNLSIIERELTLPVFVKPNVGGSSVATSKVIDKKNLVRAIDIAFEEAPEVIVEEMLIGKEFTCGCYRLGDEVKALPISEVISKNEFFDFEAKYQGAVEEITPARISVSLTNKIQQLTVDIYQYLNLKGIARIDYIVDDKDQISILEVNTTPGMTPTSFIPQQVEANNMKMSQFLSELIRNDLQK